MFFAVCSDTWDWDKLLTRAVSTRYVTLRQNSNAGQLQCDGRPARHVRAMHVVTVGPKFTKFWGNVGGPSQLNKNFFPFVYGAFHLEDIHA